jgi:hypothetical protein
LRAALPLRLLLDPAENAVCVAAPAQRGTGDEIVYVQVPPPREALAYAKPGDGRRIRIPLPKGGSQAIPVRSLRIDFCHERLTRDEMRTQLTQREGRQVGFAAFELAHIGHGANPSVPLQARLGYPG